MKLVCRGIAADGEQRLGKITHPTLVAILLNLPNFGKSIIRLFNFVQQCQNATQMRGRGKSVTTGREIGFQDGGTGEPSGIIYMGRRGYSLIGLWRRRRLRR